MTRVLALALAIGLLTAVRGAAFAAATPLTPMSPGFHQLLKCTPQGYVTIDVAADPKNAPDMDVTTVIAVGAALTKTIALREADGQGNIYALGYILQPGVEKRFARRLLLPAVPPAPGQHSTYFNITGIVIGKHFEGTRPARDAAGRPATGYVFSDYLSGRKLNEIVYVPGTGVTGIRLIASAGGSDVVCRLGH
jgi:hypothetical protein